VIAIDIDEYDSPLGALTGATRNDRVLALRFSDSWPAMESRLTRRFGTCELRRGRKLLQARLDAYFGGDGAAFDDLRVDPGGSDFQRAVWAALRRIPCGSTTTYSALAREIGAPTAVRAVGAANGANPIWLIIPCHRAIGRDGSLTGYAGGLERKRTLLEHERRCALRRPSGAQSAIQLP
jgi:methylated-DNA-[protein]-cysteine S-methyltransferase